MVSAATLLTLQQKVESKLSWDEVEDSSVFNSVFAGKLVDSDIQLDDLGVNGNESPVLDTESEVFPNMKIHSSVKQHYFYHKGFRAQ